MISAATGAVALVVAPLVREHGLQYLVAAVLLGGAIQIVLGLSGVAGLMRFVPRSVMIGFVNALAIMIVVAQLPYLVGVPWAAYALLAVAIAVLVGLPRVLPAVPAPLVAIVGLTAFTVVAGVAVPTVADQGALPDVPFTLDTLAIVAPYALAMAAVGLLESLLTAKVVDEVTDTRSDKHREAWGQGVANLVTGFTGGMGGCAMIGQTMINVKIGRARTRLSTFLAGAFLLVLVLVLGDVVGTIPMVVLVAIMIVVSVATFEWHSIAPATLRRMPRSETAVMVVTVAATLATHNLAIGVGTGVLTASVLFARRVAHVVEVRAERDAGTAVYRVSGQLFFASVTALVAAFDVAGDPQVVVVDLSAANVWDASTVAALDAVTARYAARGTTVTITGMNAQSASRHAALAGHLTAG